MTHAFNKLSVIMPTYNEARTVRAIVERVLKSPLAIELELICVDDCSQDGSRQVLIELAAQDERIKVLHHLVNRGKGAAIRTAIEHMTGDIAIFQDADLEYDPTDYPRILGPILDGRADAVFGSRFAASPERKVLLYWHTLGNRFLTWLTNILNDLNLTDMETGYKAVRADILRNLRLSSERFGIEPEITTRLSQWGATIYEVPIAYHGRSYVEGKKIGWKDGLEAIWLLFRFRFLNTSFSVRGGHDTLENLRSAKALNEWVLSQFEGYVGERVFEAGCGNGNITELLLDRKELMSVDIDPFYVQTVGRHFGHLANFTVARLDLEDVRSVESLGIGHFDTAICINVLEHLARPEAAIKGFASALQPGAHALILVPANASLYSPADVAMGHHRRYDRGGLQSLLDEGGFEVLEIRDFNRLGVIGWWFNKLLGRTNISGWQARAYAALIPLAKLIDRLRIGQGLSLIAIARKRH